VLFGDRLVGIITRADLLNAHLRVATIDGPAVRRALRKKGFVISEQVSRL
jgi:CBS domain-containing protein